MAQGEFTKEEAHASIVAVEQLYAAIPKWQRGNHMEHVANIVLFLEAAKARAPTEAAVQVMKEAQAARTRGPGFK